MKSANQNPANCYILAYRLIDSLLHPARIFVFLEIFLIHILLIKCWSELKKTWIICIGIRENMTSLPDHTDNFIKSIFHTYFICK